MPIYKNILSNAKSLWRRTERNVQGLLKGMGFNQAAHDRFFQNMELDRGISEVLHDSANTRLAENAAQPISETINVIGRQSGNRVPSPKIKRGIIGDSISSYAQTHGDAFTTVSISPAVEEALAEPVSRPVNVIGRQSGSRVPKNKVTHGKTGSYVKYEAPTPAVETSPIVETTSTVENIAVQSPATAPRPEPTPIVNNAPAQATDNVIPKNAQQEAVQNVEAAQASAPATAAPVNATTSSTENVQKPTHPNSPYASAYDNEGTIDDLYEETYTQAKVRAESERVAEAANGKNLPTTILETNQKKTASGQKPPVNDGTPWANGIKVALGTAVTGAALCAALSSSRGQQNNAQLYGQQPLY